MTIKHADKIIRAVLRALEEKEITVQECIDAIGSLAESEQQQTAPAQPTKTTRKKTLQRYYTNDDHLKIIQCAIALDLNCKKTAEAMGIPPITVRGHLRYAGLEPCVSQADVERVIIWRRKRKMYLDLPAPTISRKAAINYFGDK